MKTSKNFINFFKSTIKKIFVNNLIMNWHGSYLQSLGKSVRCLSERVAMRNESKSKQPLNNDNVDSDESSDSSIDNLSFTRTSSSPLFASFFSLIAQSNCTVYSRHKSIHEEYRSYRNTPTFIDREVFDDLDRTKNKSIEQPSQAMLHPVLLEPRIFKKEDYAKPIQTGNSEITSDEDKNRIINEISSFECPICLNNVKAGDLIVQAKCGHVFHHKCVQPWFVEHHSCPICRAEIESA